LQILLFSIFDDTNLRYILEIKDEVNEKKIPLNLSYIFQERISSVVPYANDYRRIDKLFPFVNGATTFSITILTIMTFSIKIIKS
jgi:hypothetical protein